MHARAWRAARRAAVSAAVVCIVLVVGACSGNGGGAGSAAAPSADASRDKLAAILDRGTLLEYFEEDYPPQSMRVDGGTRTAGTKCAANDLTADEATGFDNEITKLIAERLGVEACFVISTFETVTAGNWGDRWDIAFASGAINADRMQRLWMTQPYYYIPQRFIVRTDSPYQQLSDLDGKSIGTCTGCTVESYLKGTLKIPGVDLVQKVKDPKLVGFSGEFEGIEDLVAGHLDAFLAAEPVGAEAIAKGQPVRLLEEPAFSMYPSGFVDKGSRLAERAFYDKMNMIIQALQAEGKIKELSQRFFAQDYATQAAAFDLQQLHQDVP